MNQKVRIAYILSHPVQYISPLLAEMAGEFDLKVYYFSDANLKGAVDKEFGHVVKWDVPLLDGYSYQFIKNYSLTPGLTNRFLGLFNPGLIACLRKDPSKIVIVNGWGYFSSVLAIIGGRLLGKQIWVRGENPLSQELGKGRMLLLIKNLFLKQFLFRFINKFLYIGTESKAFYEFYGVKPYQLVYTPYSVDNKSFASRYHELKQDIPGLKVKLGLPLNKRIILTSGKYIVKKRPMDIIRAFNKLNDPNAALVMVGEGELRQEMETYIAHENLKDVYLTGFINQTRISEYYTVSDIFVMCSGPGETWGLSVNEAMNFCKPVIVTDTCGCSSDLVEEGKNGFIVEEGNIYQLTDALQRLLHDDTFRLQAGNLSGEMIEQYSIGEIIANLKAAALTEI